MLSNQKIKWIQSLSRKKFRDLHNAYVIEGTKIVEIAVLVCPEKIIHIYLLDELKGLFPDLEEKITITDELRIKKISNHSSPSPVVAIMKITPNEDMSFSNTNIRVFLDGVQDPGNIGTIIRTCDWYGIKDLIINTRCADHYSPKVLQSAMGSHFGMNIFRLDIFQLYNLLPDHHFIGTEINGDEIQSTNHFPIVLCMGSEGSGLSEETKAFCKTFYRIPGSHGRLAESLNVSVATGILLDRLFRF